MGEGRLVERSGRALGSPLRLTFVGRDPDMDAAWTATQQVFADVDATMSRFRDDSVLTQLCRQSPEHVERLPRRLVQALVAADRATRITGGSFDPRIVSALERIGYAGAAQSALEAPPVVSPGPAERVLLREGRNGPFALPLPVDLGGIGKGLALRWAARAIDSLFSLEGACSMGDVTGLAYLLDAGGDIVTRGRPSPDEPWAVGIGNPDGDNAPLAVLHLDASRAIATSSVQRLQWTWEGRTVHHLIDPRTGQPGGEGLLSVSIAAPDPAWAEVWSKALFLEGASGIASAARRRDLAAWWVTTEGVLEMTPAARQRTTWVASEA